MRKRSIRHRGRKKNDKQCDLDITSLLDILVILLVFLIKSYNTSSVSINVPEGVTLPISKSIDSNHPGVMVQVSASKIWVEDKLVLDSEQISSQTYDMQSRRIVPLYDELIRKIETVKQLEKTIPGAIPFSGTINLIVDKSIKYSFIKKLLFTSAEAGFKTYKFVVLGEEQ